MGESGIRLHILYQAVYSLPNLTQTTVSTRLFHNYSPELLQD